MFPRYRRWLVVAGLICAVVIVVCFGVRRRALSSGLEKVFARIRVGMSQHEAVAVLLSCDPYNIDSHQFSGTTRDGRSFCEFISFKLPPAEDIEEGELAVMDVEGREVVVTLERGGIVTDKRISSPRRWEDWRLRVRGVFGF